MITKNGLQLAEAIKKAINDLEVTSAEYEEIYQIAGDNGHLDNHEKVLLREFKKMIADKTIRRVP
jgi:hypothetical protein